MQRKVNICNLILMLKHRYLTFYVAGELFALPLFKVKEFVGAEEILSHHSASELSRNIVSIRGKAVSLIDLRKELNLTTISSSNSEFSNRFIIILKASAEVSVGVIADSVSRVMVLDMGFERISFECINDLTVILESNHQLYKRGSNF